MSRVSGWLVSYDIPGIQRYVFAPVRPMDIMGGSALLEQFGTDAAHEIASGFGASVVYSGGGGALLLVGSEQEARKLEQALRERLAELTAGAAVLVSASVRLDEGLVAARACLRQRLADARLHRLIDQSTEVLLPAGTHPNDVCQACGLELADQDNAVGTGPDREHERIGPQCAARRAKGRDVKTVETIRDLFPAVEVDDRGRGDRLSRGAVLAAVYLDGDGLGRKLGQIAELETLARASKSVTQGIHRALELALRAVGSAPVLAPIVGGDDVVLFCDARHSGPLLHRLWEELDQHVRLDDQPVRFSAAIVLSDPYLPLRILFDEAKRALGDAKVLSRRSGRPHVELRSLVPGRFHAGRGASLAGVPLPRDRFWADSASLRSLLRCLDAVASAQRSAMANDLEEESHELRELVLDERRVRADERGETAVGRAVDEGRDLATRVGSTVEATLAAALALHPLWKEAV